MRMLAWLLFLIVYVVVAGTLSELGHGLGGFGNYLIGGLLSFFAILVHELGHALAVRWVGGRVDKIVVMPFELGLRPRRLKLAGRGVRGDIGGYVAFRLGTAGTPRNHAIVAAAGPIANFALALAAGLLTAWLASSTLFPAGAAGPAGLLPSDAEMADYASRYSAYRAWHAAGTLANALAILSAGRASPISSPLQGATARRSGARSCPGGRADPRSLAAAQHVA